jgi:hypothetical protein
VVWAAVLALGCSSGTASLPVGACRSATDCEMGEFCQKPDGECSGIGECARRPEMCAQMHQPVCGCDGMDYSNPCVAAAAGTSVDKPGTCSLMR